MNINEHPIYKAIYDLCQEIEKLPASDQATKVVVMASALENPVRDLLAQKKVLVEALRRIADDRSLQPIRLAKQALKACKEETR